MIICIILVIIDDDCFGVEGDDCGFKSFAFDLLLGELHGDIVELFVDLNFGHGDLLSDFDCFGFTWAAVV